MYSVKTVFTDEPITPSLTNLNGIGNEPDPSDVWLFTDPSAKAYISWCHDLLLVTFARSQPFTRR